MRTSILVQETRKNDWILQWPIVVARHTALTVKHNHYLSKWQISCQEKKYSGEAPRLHPEIIDLEVKCEEVFIYLVCVILIREWFILNSLYGDSPVVILSPLVARKYISQIWISKIVRFTKDILERKNVMLELAKGEGWRDARELDVDSGAASMLHPNTVPWWSGEQRIPMPSVFDDTTFHVSCEPRSYN